MVEVYLTGPHLSSAGDQVAEFSGARNWRTSRCHGDRIRPRPHRPHHAIDDAPCLARLDAFRQEDDSSADRAIRRRVEGAVIASELTAGEPSPRLAAEEPDDAPPPLAE